MSEFEPDARLTIDLAEVKRLTEAWRVAEIARENAKAMLRAAENENAATQLEASQALLRLRLQLKSMDADRTAWAIPIDDAVAIVDDNVMACKILPVTQLNSK